jgi:hypothetical protein
MNLQKALYNEERLASSQKEMLVSPFILVGYTNQK